MTENRSTSTSKGALIPLREAAETAGDPMDHAYDVVRYTDEYCGIEVVRIGKRIYLPRRPFERKLGLLDDGDAA